jgi:hypothetical protein
MARSDADHLVVVVDQYGGDWTPVAAFYERQVDEAEALCGRLRLDASARCSRAPYYPSEESVESEAPDTPPDGLVGEEVAVVVRGGDATASARDDATARAAQVEMGGLRTGVPVYATAEDAIEERPALGGRFIDAEQRASDLLQTEDLR